MNPVVHTYIFQFEYMMILTLQYLYDVFSLVFTIFFVSAFSQFSFFPFNSLAFLVFVVVVVVMLLNVLLPIRLIFFSSLFFVILLSLSYSDVFHNFLNYFSNANDKNFPCTMQISYIYSIYTISVYNKTN